jgi:hypothetical protein
MPFHLKSPEGSQCEGKPNLLDIPSWPNLGFTPSPNYLLLTIPPSLSLKLPLLFSQLEGPAGGSLLMKDLSNNYDWLDPLTGPWHLLGSG